MRTLLMGGLVVLAAVALLPDTSATPCDVGDSEHVCIEEEADTWGDCGTNGYAYRYTAVSASVLGENLYVSGYNYCYNEPGWGTNYQGQGVTVMYAGAHDQAALHVSGQQNLQNEWGYCQLHWHHGGPGHQGGGHEELDMQVCEAIHGLPWGGVLP